MTTSPLSESSIYVNWLDFHPRKWNSDVLRFHVSWKKADDEVGNYTEVSVEDDMTQYETSRVLEYTINDLEIFTLYSIRVFTVNDVGVGEFTEVLQRSGQGGKWVYCCYETKTSFQAQVLLE